MKTLAGQENAVSELVRIVRVSEADKTVLKAVLGALAVLSSDDRNLKKMTAEGHALARACWGRAHVWLARKASYI